MAYQCLIEAAGRCPPEDVGGPWGYRDLLNAIADPNHQEHAERLEWVGSEFDPNNTDVEALIPILSEPDSRGFPDAGRV